LPKPTLAEPRALPNTPLAPSAVAVSRIPAPILLSVVADAVSWVRNSGSRVLLASFSGPVRRENRPSCTLDFRPSMAGLALRSCSTNARAFGESAFRASA
jgi:hypothetical protein